MSTDGDGQPAASVVVNQTMFSLCLAVVCLETIVMSPAQEPISQILLPLSLATGYALAMASIFAPPGTTMKGLAARLSVVSAAISVLLLMSTELVCEVQACYFADGA